MSSEIKGKENIVCELIKGSVGIVSKRSVVGGGCRWRRRRRRQRQRRLRRHLAAAEAQLPWRYAETSACFNQGCHGNRDPAIGQFIL